MTDYITQMNERFPALVEDFITKMKTENEITDSNAGRLREMFTYNCVGGKVFRGIQVLTYSRQMAAIKGKNFADIEKSAFALAWAVEVLQACFLVADDIMDKSQTRRGQPCWYLVPSVQMDAVNDALILESFMYFLIREYITDKEVKYHVLDLFADTCLKTQIGQMTDLLSQPQGKKGLEVLNSFSLDVHARIVKYKTAFYTFFLPIAAGLALAGVTDAAVLKAVSDICVEIGTKFQIQDDYLDCYGLPEMIGKIGTDIQDHKCSWLVVKALEVCTPEQRKVIEENYGHEEPEKIAKIKALYNEVGIPAIYAKQEEESLKRINDLLEAKKDLIAPELFTDIVKRVHGRQK